MSTKRKISLLLITLLLLAAGITLAICKSHFFDAKAPTKPKKKKVLESTYYQLEIESPAAFTAIISTRASHGIIEDSANLIHFDTLQKQLRNWRIKISGGDKIIQDTVITITNNESLKRGIMDIFSAIPHQSPKNAWFEYKYNKFIPHEAINGNQLNTDLLSKQVIAAIKDRKKKILLNRDVSYLKASFDLESTETKQALKDLNKCLYANICYTLRNEQITLKKEVFALWLRLDSTMHVDVNTTKAMSFIRSMADKNDMVVKNITFTTSAGATKTIHGGDLGYRINIYKELFELCKNIKNGLVITREPIYGMRGIPNGAFDTNKTYIEINISAQKLWYYKAGVLIIESDIVTGNLSNGNGTPNGAYYIKYKELNATLKGPGYSTGVSYWMPFNESIGLHDAKWRGSFGGSIYKSNGSHGCINLPFLTAQTIYNNVSPGGIVICYTD
jgi:hypothetical protein